MHSWVSLAVPEFQAGIATQNATSKCILWQDCICREYLQALVGYFESFYARTQPLGSLGKMYVKLGDFEAKFKAGEVPEWNDKGSGDGNEPSNVLDMTAFATVEEVESLGELPEEHRHRQHPSAVRVGIIGT